MSSSIALSETPLLFYFFPCLLKVLHVGPKVPRPLGLCTSCLGAVDTPPSHCLAHLSHLS